MNMLNRFNRSSSSINWMYVPALIFFIVFIAYPFIQGIMISFTDWNGYSETWNMIGLDNYKRLFSDKNMGLVIANTFIFGVLSTLFQNLFGLLYAFFVDMKFRFRGLVRTIVYLPVIVSPLIMGYILYYFFQYNGGALNEIMAWFGVAPRNWLDQWGSAVTSIVVVNTFQYVGPAMIIYLTGLQSISHDYYEAAELDGASSFAKFKSITLPLLMPAITINVVYNLIGGLKLFDIIMALTGGGPGYTTSSLSTFMYAVYSGQQDAGYATAIGNLMFVIIGLIGLLVLNTLRKKEVEY
ncbi:carbohydrate ABC transporter permease [Paenibacillus macerans]|uniref:carbohydrate ABC transporter permease n=1 Tax=Paenibacillus macerans TaxID=44252 RepID=UPI003D319D76